jgi:hypothetical protein
MAMDSSKKTKAWIDGTGMTACVPLALPVSFSTSCKCRWTEALAEPVPPDGLRVNGANHVSAQQILDAAPGQLKNFGICFSHFSAHQRRSAVARARLRAKKHALQKFDRFPKCAILDAIALRPFDRTRPHGLEYEEMVHSRT